MTTVAQRLMQELVAADVRQFYGVQGGACAHMIQAAALGEGSAFIPVLNEQVAGLYAHGAFKASGHIGGAIVTTGPGFFNLVTSIAACYYDRVPFVVLCGQINAQSNLAQAFGTRMFGFQEAEHAAVASHISEHTVRVTDGASLSRALSLIRSIRQHSGPLFIEVQDDLQRQSAVSLLGEFHAVPASPALAACSEHSVTQAMQTLRSAQRPLILVGAGVDAQAFVYVNRLSEQHRMPLLFTWGAQWLMDAGNPLHQGIFGNHAPGRGNALLRQADALLVLGASLLQHQVGKSYDQFAPQAKIVFVNVDHAECSRFAYSFLSRAHAIHADAGRFIQAFAQASKPTTPSVGAGESLYWSGYTWVPTTKTPRDLPHVHVAVQVLVNVLEACPKDATVFSDAGATLSWTYQAANLVAAPPLHTAYNLHTMGYAVPASIGAAIANGKTAVSISGDGGFMMNLQELALVVGRKVKTVILDNQGYGIIRQTQDDFLGGRHCGSSKVHAQAALPPYAVDKLVSAFGIPCRRCAPAELPQHLVWLFENDEARALVIDIDFGLKVHGVGV